MELDPKLDKKLHEYAIQTGYIKDRSHILTDEGINILLKAHVDTLNTETLLKDISNLEKILNAKYIGYISLSGYNQLKFKFNNKKSV